MSVEFSHNCLEPNIVGRRNLLQEILNSQKYGYIPKMEGIVRHISARELSPDLECSSFALNLPPSAVTNEVIRILAESKEITNPQKGDLVLYFQIYNGVEYLTHMGIFLREGYVRSKWGDLDVFDHPTFLVPFSYGNLVKYVKNPSL